jgi:NAD(P)-dependent dehydrogenase (short-subunit alcohol dehydrogenase family)
MMSKKDPGTSIVTGAARCTVAAVAERPAGDGFDVVINYAGEHGSAAALVARIQQLGWNAMVNQADVAINLKGVFSGLRDASKRIVLEDLLSPRMN